eukprot:GILI01017926.1.p1 GENE.GILI01017926.1~~GILI01017926.1.p1  ORF type:complete len:242 (+),score=63.71 GILI01017926.1:192-917(+)
MVNASQETPFFNPLVDSKPASSSPFNPLTQAPVMEARRRNRPGSKASEISGWPSGRPAEYDGLFGTQEYLQQLIRDDPANVRRLVEVPEGKDSASWQFEHIRQMTLELNQLLVCLSEACTPSLCPKMKATDEWLYLCAAHKTTQDCCAIDYMLHTIDNATALLNNTKYFPSRLNVPQASIKHFQSIVRRLYRIFAHAYFHHRSIFDSFEASTHLCERFSLFCLKFDLIPEKLLTVPIPKPS